MKKAVWVFMVILIAGMLTVCGSSPESNTRRNTGGSGLDNRRIYIQNNEFMVGGKKIWINGVNTPWEKWNDFGGRYDESWWDDEFAKLKDAGINATRVWINCNGHGYVEIHEDGFVTGADDWHWDHLDSFFELARKHRLYIMATLTSFDHFKTENYKSDRWQAMIRSKENVRSFADNYTKEFVNRYKNNPYLWSIDLMNEPEWISEGEGMNPFADRISWKDLQYFFAYNSAVIRENSNILITVGIGYAKYNVDGNGFDGNMVSDAALKAQYNNKNAYIDFWSPHYYDWVGEWYGVAHYLNPYGSRQGSRTAGYHGGMGLNPSKPAVIAECSAKGTSGSRRFIRPEDQPPGANTIITDFEYAYLNGWQGVMPWTSNYIDGNGGLSDMAPATKYMLEKYRNLIFPFDD